MRRLHFLILLILILTTSCSKKLYLNVYQIDKVNKYVENPIIYALPKTKIVVAVNVNKIIENKAPFADYTEKYLGSLKDVIRENNTYWEIADVNFFTIPEVDTSQIYVISSNVPNLTDHLNLTKEGFLISINSQTDYNINLNLPETPHKQNTGIPELSFAQISVDKTFKEVYDTVYRTQKYDTVFKQVPIVKKSVIKKSTEEQAKELAEEIFTLRDDKAALLVGEGDSEYLPEGDALQIMLKGIDKLEQEYLSMFAGRRDTITLHYIFTFTPEYSQASYQKILFRFSDKKGILPAESIEGEPVILQITSQKTTDKVKNFTFQQSLYKDLEKKKEDEVGLYYRLPEKARVMLKYKSSSLGKKDIYIAQYGVVLPLPKRILFEKDVKIEFYPDLGSIKSITKINQNADR